MHAARLMRMPLGAQSATIGIDEEYITLPEVRASFTKRAIPYHFQSSTVTWTRDARAAKGLGSANWMSKGSTLRDRR